MDLVDIDKVLDDLESLEQNSVASDKQQSRMHSEHSSTNRRIKVSSVLSSLNDYVEYDRKVPAPPPAPDCVAATTIAPPQNENAEVLCEQTAGAELGSVNKASSLIAGNDIDADSEKKSPQVDGSHAIEPQIESEVTRIEPSEVVVEEERERIVKIPTATVLEEKRGPSIPSITPNRVEVSAESSTAPAPVVSESDCDENETHVTPSPVSINPADEKALNNSGNCASTVTEFQAVEVEEEDLEKYLNDLEMEYDNQVKPREGGNEGIEETKEVIGRETIPEDRESEQEETKPPPVPIREDLPLECLEITRKKEESKLKKVPESESSQQFEETASDSTIEEPEDGKSLEEVQEMNMDDIRELERLIQQQELEEQMELDRQMAMKLQEGDDADLVQSLTEDTLDAVPDHHAPPPPSSSSSSSTTRTVTEQTDSEARSSPLEAPPSVTNRLSEDDPEYRFLMALGKVAPYWVPDTTHDNCMQCDQKFSLLKRRHHCRCCGELLCAACCSFRAQLEYMREQAQLLAASSSSSSSPTNDWPEARICKKCDKLVQRRDELLQLRYLADCGIGEDSGLAEFPIKGVLKKPKSKPKIGEAAAAVEDDDEETTDNSDSTAATPTKAVIFSDGIRPGHDDFNEETQRSRRRSKAKAAPVPEPPAQSKNAQEVQSPSESEVVARALNSYKAFVTALKMFYNIQSQSYLPPSKIHLPPLLKNCGGFLPVVELKNDFHTCKDLCDFLKSERRDYLIQKRLHCAVKIIDYRVDANQLDNQCRWCLNVTTNGMSLVGQQEFVVLIEMNAEYFTTSNVDDKRNLKFLLLLLRRLFVHFNKIYMRIYSELSLELRAKRKMELAQLQHPDPSFLLDNRVVVSPFYYFNKAYGPQLAIGGGGKVAETDTNGNESDESEKDNYICDKYTFLKTKNRFVQNMDLQKITLGTKGDPDFYLDFNAILYVRASLQSTANVILPDRNCGEVLFGLFVKHTEIPWAKLFPLRLLLRMGAEYHLYPWPLFNALDRKCLYSEFVDNSIIHFLADFRNFSFSLNEIPGLHMHMEHDKVIPALSDDAGKGENVRVKIFLPKINYKRIEAMINDSSESILSFFGALNQKADGHLVCIQGDGKSSSSGSVAYSTQSLNIEGAVVKGYSKTGINFFILNGALKSTTGLKAKMSIIEDGVMVQVLPQIMAQVRSALLEMRDFEIKCEDNEEKVGPSERREASGVSEVINFVWTNAPVIETIIGLKSEIDERSLENCSFVNMICDFPKKADPAKSGQSSRSMFGLRSSSRLEMDCFYLHLHKVVLLEEKNYFALFNEKMLHVSEEGEENGDEASTTGGPIDENANLIKSLNVSNWEVHSINFLIKLSALLGRIVERALSKHYSKLYDEKMRRIGVRFHFAPDQIVTYDAGSGGTKLPMAYMNDLDMNLIPMLHHILELNAKDSVLQYNKNGAAANTVGHNLNGEFLDRINLLQNLKRGITFELVFDIVIDLP